MMTTDCHVHVIGDPAIFPMMSPRIYTPLQASKGKLQNMMRRVGIDRVVIVQLSVYGTDNACMVDAMPAFGGSVRGVIHTSPDTTAAELDDYHAKGVRGIRLNLHSAGVYDSDTARQHLKDTSAQCARNGWHLQLFTSPRIIEELEADIAACPVPVVLDHFGMLPTRARGGASEHAVRRLLSGGHIWIKLSGTYRLDHPDAGGLARDLFADNPDQLVWGSDWPHTPQHAGILQNDPESLPFHDLDPADLLRSFRGWFDADRAVERLLSDNPARLYDF